VARLEPRPPRSAASGRRRRRRRRLRVPVGPILVLFLLSCVVLAAYYASQTVYFVGVDDGFVTVYRGMPYDLPAGLDLYTVNYRSGVPADELTPAQRRTVTAHKLRSKNDAQDLVRQLETGELAAQ
jgi:protein phosphatase